MDDFGIMENEGSAGTGKENQADGQALGVRNQRTATPLDAMALDNGDGMKTSEEITTYDPIANPMENPLQNKQGIGSAGYDYSNLMTDPNRE